MLRLWIVVTFAACVPALVCALGGVHATPLVEIIVFGGAILAGAFILSWAAEVAQKDMSQALAIAILALICVLPEYAVDMYFAWTAAAKPEYAQYAAANMTGANRLIVGIGWPAVFLIYALRYRRRSMTLETSHRTELIFLGLATLWAFRLPFAKSITLVDTAVYLILYGLYTWRVSQAEAEEPDLVGPARLMGGLSQKPRRWAEFGMFAFSALVILLSAQRFADSLINTGRQFHINEFLLVQWIAPLASEAPEFIVALLWSFRGDVSAGLGALVSSRVNQWTLLVGTLPVSYALHRYTGHFGPPYGLPLSGQQHHELGLTACQSLFAVAVLLNLRMSWYGALLLFLLFAVQLVFEHIRVEVSFVYLGLALLIFARDWRHLRWRGGGAPSGR